MPPPYCASSRPQQGVVGQAGDESSFGNPAHEARRAAVLRGPAKPGSEFGACVGRVHQGEYTSMVKLPPGDLSLKASLSDETSAKCPCSISKMIGWLMAHSGATTIVGTPLPSVAVPSTAGCLSRKLISIVLRLAWLMESEGGRLTLVRRRTPGTRQ